MTWLNNNWHAITVIVSIIALGGLFLTFYQLRMLQRSTRVNTLLGVHKHFLDIDSLLVEKPRLQRFVAAETSRSGIEQTEPHPESKGDGLNLEDKGFVDLVLDACELLYHLDDEGIKLRTGRPDYYLEKLLTNQRVIDYWQKLPGSHTPEFEKHVNHLLSEKASSTA